MPGLTLPSCQPCCQTPAADDIHVLPFNTKSAKRWNLKMWTGHFIWGEVNQQPPWNRGRQAGWFLTNYTSCLYFRYSRLSHPFSSALWFLQDDPVVWLDLSVMENANWWWLFPQVHSDLNTSLHKCSQHVIAYFFIALRKQRAHAPCPGDKLLILLKLRAWRQKEKRNYQKAPHHFVCSSSICKDKGLCSGVLLDSLQFPLKPWDYLQV